MIPALGAGGPGFESRIGPFATFFYIVNSQIVEMMFVVCLGLTPFWRRRARGRAFWQLFILAKLH